MNIISVYNRFPDQASCIAYLEQQRWSRGRVCPYCESTRSTPYKHRYTCRQCHSSFSVTVGTVFHRTHLPLQKWFLAISLVLNAKKGLSGRQLARDLEVDKNTAWRMTMMIRNAMAYQGELLEGIVEMDETYVGGKPRKKTGGTPAKRGRGTKKTAVVGAVERGGDVVTKAMGPEDRLTAEMLNKFITDHVRISDTTLMTDEYKGYASVKNFMAHLTINHSVEYARGNVHTNCIESYWAIVKRGIMGQYHKVSAKYLPKYLDEFSYRFNNRDTDPDKFFENTLKRCVTL